MEAYDREEQVNIKNLVPYSRRLRPRADQKRYFERVGVGGKTDISKMTF